MNKKIYFLLFLALPALTFAQVFKTTSANIKFFSEAPLENIEAENEKAQSVLNTETGEMGFVATIRGFKFEKPLMEEHFNENYMESDKYKTGKFYGKLNEQIDFSKDGKHDASVTGKLTIHGVEKERTIKGTLEIKGSTIILDSKFIVALEDHKIKIPKVVVQNIAEEVEVTVHAEYAPKK